MKTSRQFNLFSFENGFIPAAACVVLFITAAAIGCQKDADEILPGNPTPGASNGRMADAHFVQVNLVSNHDGAGAAQTNADLAHAWGLYMGPGSRGTWVTSVDKGLALQFDELGNSLQAPLIVGDAEQPTAIVASGGNFSGPDMTRPVDLLFADLSGRIMASEPGGNTVQPMIDRSAKGAKYTGLAIVTLGARHFLYAADFANGRIDVFDERFGFVPHRALADPNLPEGYAPYNLKFVDGELYVVYAMHARNGEAMTGSSRGWVSVFRADGSFVRSLDASVALNAPWGIEVAGQHVLVANHGDGTINIYDRASGRYQGKMMTGENVPLTIEGLRGISFNASREMRMLYFTASPYDHDGLFGYLKRSDDF